VANAILVEGLRKRYGDVVALDGVDLAVPEGTVLGLLGPNGAGKTTAVRVLTTLTKPDAGRAEVAGLDVVREPARVRTLIGLAGQYAAVDENLTGRENLALVGRLNHMARADCRSRATALLERFQLSDAADRPVKTYSGGMRRRLDLSLALVNRPPVLFLDEPTTGLDPRSRTELWTIIGELVSEGTSLLLTTQYLEEADRLADRIAVIDVGRVIAEGTSEELKGRLGGTSLEVGVTDETAAKEAAEVLAPIGTLAERDGNGTVLKLTVDDGPRALVEVVRGLDARGIAATTLALREPSLDDVFLALTGHAAANEDGSSAEADGETGRGRRGLRRRGAGRSA
jgi:ABC-2 type transport system ATP-binding protein